MTIVGSTRQGTQKPNFSINLSAKGEINLALQDGIAETSEVFKASEVWFRAPGAARSAGLSLKIP
jgi:hypothetical protein